MQRLIHTLHACAHPVTSMHWNLASVESVPRIVGHVHYSSLVCVVDTVGIAVRISDRCM